MTVGQRIKQLREAHNMSPFYLSMEIGSTYSTIYQYESDSIKKKRKYIILAMCYVFGMTYEEFMKGVERDSAD